MHRFLNPFLRNSRSAITQRLYDYFYKKIFIGGNTSSNTSKKSEDDENDTKVTFSKNTNLLDVASEPLCDSSNKFLSPLMENALPMKTPTTNRKRKLFTHTPGPDVSS